MQTSSKIKVIFLDMDGVMNSTQGMNYYHCFIQTDKEKAEDKKNRELELFAKAGFSDRKSGIDILEMNEYEELLCPLACSNLKYIMRKYPDIRLVISSTWRRRKERTIKWWNWYFKQWKIINEDAVIGETPVLSGKDRGDEIQDWLDGTEHTVDNFAILDDDSDMAHLRDTHHFIQTDGSTGFDWICVERLEKLFGSFTIGYEDLVKGKQYHLFCKPHSMKYTFDGEKFYYYDEEGNLHDNVFFSKTTGLCAPV